MRGGPGVTAFEITTPTGVFSVSVQWRSGLQKYTVYARLPDGQAVPWGEVWSWR